MKYGRVTVENAPGNPLGEDEPVFLIRGRDAVAIVGILAYGHAAEAAGVDLATGLSNVIARFEEWQQANPELVKLPD
jgi:hypothetical protein